MPCPTPRFCLYPVMLNTLVAEVAEMSEKISNRKIILMSTDRDVVACAAQDRLQQVLINLVENAIKIWNGLTREVYRGRQLIEVTAKEFNLL